MHAPFLRNHTPQYFDSQTFAGNHNRGNVRAKGVPNAKDAVEVLGAPGNGTRLFVIVPSERAKAALAEELLGITGNPHPTAGDVWILDEAQSLALIEAAGRSKLPDASPTGCSTSAHSSNS